MTEHDPVGVARATAPYLLISRIGPGSLHPQWLPSPGEGGFDMLLSCYAPETRPVEAPGILFEYRSGSKVAGYGEILREHAALISQYRYVALLDDDLSTDARSILRLFEIIDEHRLKIAQPALDHESYFTYACLLQHKGFTLRHVNFVEMMCPFFRSDVLLEMAPLFNLGFESGIDLVWSALANDAPEDFAVIDSVPVRHTRPVGVIKASNGFVDGRNYRTDIEAILTRFQLPWLPALPHGGLRPDGRYTRRLLALCLDAGGLTAAIPIRSSRFRLRAIATYWRQLLWSGTRRGSATATGNPPVRHRLRRIAGAIR